ncbi:ABC transporter substrate-binding protein [Petroclostridium sp. X23]|uniref:ABC transporter substrate-binding protein n=1 Tax=Petroclostridium sp. X23 TaxID=3045146 RepID=UPI0024ADF862|nr:ABC transporter substrate-binding protein [Petroclostridium sp. X23]WHH57948.1 ABC transporter substrate-binding protein [Petroclostridium sp. X23]
MHKRYVSLALCIYLLAGILTGCSIPFLSSFNTEKERTLVFSHRDVENREIYETLAGEYMKEHAGLTIEVQVIPPEEYTDTWLQGLSDQNIADVFAVPADEDFEAFIGSGRLLDLNKSNVLPEGYNSSLLQIGTRDGHVRAVPVTGSVPVVFYNKMFFEKCGLVLPQTISDLVVNCLILQQNGIIPLAMYRDENGFLDTVDLIEGILANGACDTGLMSNGEFFDKNTELDSGFYDAVGLAFELTMSDLIVKKEESVQGHQMLLEQFAKGACAMIPGDSNDIRKLQELSSDFDSGFFLMPGSSRTYTGVFKADMMLGISKSSKVVSDAKGFIHYLLSLEGQELLCNQAGRIPATNHVIISDANLAAAQAFLDTPDRMYPSLFQRISKDKRAICVEKLDLAFSGSGGILEDDMLDWITRLKAVR